MAKTSGDKMNKKINLNDAGAREKWHLTETEVEQDLTEIEFLLWRLSYSMERWHEDCQRFVGTGDFNASEVAMMHCIRMHDNPKSISDISRLMNRDDTSNIQYSLRKLIKQGIIKKSNTGKTAFYTMTEKGITATDRYTEIRRKIIINLFKEKLPKEKSEVLCKFLIEGKHIFDEASRLINVTYKQPTN